MTVAELIAALGAFPPEAKVVVRGQNDSLVYDVTEPIIITAEQFKKNLGAGEYWADEHGRPRRKFKLLDPEKVVEIK